MLIKVMKSQATVVKWQDSMPQGLILCQNNKTFKLEVIRRKRHDRGEGQDQRN